MVVMAGSATPERDDDADADHLPKVAYDVHTRKIVAGMLAEWDLPTQGDKDVLAKRHKRCVPPRILHAHSPTHTHAHKHSWVILYNANVDRAPAHRHTHEQLRAELRKLEEADQRARKETVDDPVAYQVRVQPARCGSERAYYVLCALRVLLQQKVHKAAFAQLTAAARPKTKHESRSGTQGTQAADADADALATNGAQGSDESAQGEKQEGHGHIQVGHSDVIDLDEESDVC